MKQPWKKSPPRSPGAYRVRMGDLANGFAHVFRERGLLVIRCGSITCPVDEYWQGSAIMEGVPVEWLGPLGVAHA